MVVHCRGVALGLPCRTPKVANCKPLMHVDSFAPWQQAHGVCMCQVLVSSWWQCWLWLGMAPGSMLPTGGLGRSTGRVGLEKAASFSLSGGLLRHAPTLPCCVLKAPHCPPPQPHRAPGLWHKLAAGGWLPIAWLHLACGPGERGVGMGGLSLSLTAPCNEWVKGGGMRVDGVGAWAVSSHWVQQVDSSGMAHPLG